MFHVEPDAWANVTSAVIVCISIFNSIVRKLSKKRTQANLLWYYTEVSSSLLVALVAWEMYPFVTILHSILPQSVYTAVAVHLGVRFIQKLHDVVSPT